MILFQLFIYPLSSWRTNSDRLFSTCTPTYLSPKPDRCVQSKGHPASFLKPVEHARIALTHQDRLEPAGLGSLHNLI